MAKTEQILIRVTPKQKERIKSYCEKTKKTYSELMLLGFDKAIEKVKVQNVVVHQADPKLIAEIAKIGNNINQIARAVNQRSDSLNVLVELQSINERLKSVLEYDDD